MTGPSETWNTRVGLIVFPRAHRKVLLHRSLNRAPSLERPVVYTSAQISRSDTVP